MDRNASARWTGDLKSGKGTIKLGSGAFEGAYSFSTRFEGAPGTNPDAGGGWRAQQQSDLRFPECARGFAFRFANAGTDFGAAVVGCVFERVRH